MSLYSPFGVPLPSSPLEAISRALFHLAIQSLEWDPATGAVIAESGHTGILTRGATASPVDSNGTSYTAQYQQLPLEVRPFLNAGTRDTAMILLGTGDTWPFASQFIPGALGGLAEFVETTTCGFRFSISNAGVTGAHLKIDNNSGKYRITHNNGIDAAVTSTMATGTSAGDRIQLFWYLYPDGSVQMWQTNLAVGQIASALSSVPAAGIASAWPSSTSVYVNSNGSSGNGQCSLRRLKLLAGNPDFSTLQTLR